MPLYNELQEFGLDEKKSKVYLALLELGEAKAFDIAKKTKLERPTIYDVLEKLSSEGLVSHYQKRGVRYFIAENPIKIKRILEEKQNHFDIVLPQLQSIYNSLSKKPVMRFFEGIEGVKTIFEDTLTAKNKDLCGILSMVDLYHIPGKRYMDDYVKRRVSAGYRLRVVRSKSKEREETWPTSSGESRNLRYSPAAMIFSMTVYIYDNKIGLISTHNENFGLIIESEEFTNTARNLFEALWQISQVQ